jgi:chemosensory pili system protein ChpA (sensor histidine kinase/response regulator)
MNKAIEFDIGPLSWVKGEIDQAMERASQALKKFAENTEDAKQLKFCQTHLHQAVGALQIVGLDGVTRLAEEIEALLADIEKQAVLPNPAIFELLDRAFANLSQYLDGLISGEKDQPLKLFAIYQEVLKTRGSTVIAESDLFFPDLSLRPPKREAKPVVLSADQLRAELKKERSRFQRGFLAWLKDSSNDGGLKEMYGSIAAIENTQSMAAHRAFWWVTMGLLDALVHHGLPAELNLKRLCARIDLQMRRLIEGSQTVAERLMRDALYFVARSEPASDQVREVKRIYALDGMIPATEGAVDVTPLLPVLRALREAVQAAKDAWNKYSSGNKHALVQFTEQAGKLRTRAPELGRAEFTSLVNEIASIGDALTKAPQTMNESIGMETATALLLAENAIDNFAKLSHEFGHQVEVMVARLKACLTGKSAEGIAEVPLLDEMSRRASEKILMTQVVSEIKNNLHQIEQALDAFFRNAEKRGELNGLDKPVHQIVGALTILSQDKAVAVLQNCAKQIKKFADPAYAPQQQDFERVAHDLSGLGFYVDSLQYGQQLDFDEVMRPIGSKKGEKRDPEETLSDLVPPPATVEVELEKQTRDAKVLLDQLQQQPNDAALKAELRQNLTAIQKDADLVANAALEKQAEHALNLLETSGEELTTSLVEAISSLVPTQPEIAPPSDETKRLIEASDAVIDAELLSIFLEEAQEVLRTIQDNLDLSRAQPHEREFLTVIRRATHTLKGSSRMVGLNRFGECAWHVEQVMNKWLQEEQPATPALHGMVEMAHAFFLDWVEQLNKSGTAEVSPDKLLALVEELKGKGTAAPQIAPVAPASSASAAPAPAAATPSAEAGPVAEELDVSFTIPDLPEIAAPAAPAAAPAVAAELDPDAIRIGDIELSRPLYDVFLAEAGEHLGILQAQHAAFSGEPTNGVTHEATRAAHTIAGISGTVGFLAVNEYAIALEHVLQRLEEAQVPGSEAPAKLIGDAVARLSKMVEAVQEMRTPEPDPVGAKALRDWLDDTGSRLEIAGQAPDSFSIDIGMLAGEAAADAAAAEPVAEEAPPPALASIMDSISLDLDTPETPATPPVERPTASPAAIAEAAQPAAPGPAPFTAPVAQAPEFPVGGDTPQDAADDAAAQQAELMEERRRVRVHDDIDQQLLPIFLEEAQELVPQIGNDIRDWRANPQDQKVAHSLQRLLHTFKGSARMAGAMGLGELTHNMETRIENAVDTGVLPAALFDGLETSFDRVGFLLDQLQRTGSAEPISAEEQAAAAGAGPTVAVEAAPAGATPAQLVAAKAPERAAEPETPRAMLRIRADLADRLVNEVGEISIARSRVEVELKALKTSLLDLTENVIRLRGQLREIEIQAESQLQSKQMLSGEVDANFDPLEFDRFTRFQELTRMMAESVNDVATVQQGLLRNLDETDAALIAQSRMNRELAQDLMSIRMVPFGNISDRLYRIARQAAKELGKKVTVDIRGSQVEIDRGVLERITAPLEHLLRNSMTHGIEDRATRERLGKSDTGEIRLELRQEGNDIVLIMSDDGAGLNIPRIRAKAIENGLMKETDDLSEMQIAEFIFGAGLSTATEVTQLAGRGVGMDVVRDEVTALGGRIEMAWEKDKGSRFTIFLPLTLAVTQALLVSAGGNTYAVQSVLVEQLQEYKPEGLESLYKDRAAQIAARRYPFYYLPQLLGQGDKMPEARRHNWVMFARSGTQRCALHVDEVLGNQEIVIKNIGPQLSKVPGIAGATVSTDGAVVLMLNPIQLVQRFDALTPVSVETTVSKLVPETVVVSTPTIMVVDDSLTVRKITGRLLARENYQVLTAKDGVDALEQLQETIPDVMLVDIEMPRMDGFDLTRNVRNDPRLAGIPIIIISSRTADKHRRYGAEIGVNVFLGKPYQEEELLTHIASFIKRGGGATLH